MRQSLPPETLENLFHFCFSVFLYKYWNGETELDIKAAETLSVCMCDKIFALYDSIKIIDTAMCWGDLELVKVLGWVGVHQNVLLVSHYIFYEYVVEKESFYFIYRRAGP